MKKNRLIVFGVLIFVLLVLSTYDFLMLGRKQYSHSILESKVRGTFIFSYTPSIQQVTVGGDEIKIIEVFVENGWRYGSFVWLTQKEELYANSCQLILRMSDSDFFHRALEFYKYRVVDNNGNVFLYGGTGMFSCEDLKCSDMTNFTLFFQRVDKDSTYIEGKIDCKRSI